MTQAEEMRQKRNNEAKELIGSRVGTAKAIFTQHTSSGQMQTKAPIKPVRNSIAQRINTLNSNTEPVTNNAETAQTVHTITEVIEETSAPLVNKIQEHIIDKTKEEFAANEANEGITATNELNNVNQQNDHYQQQEYDDDGDQFSTIKRSPYSKSNSNNSQVSTPVESEPPKEFQEFSAATESIRNQPSSTAVQHIGNFHF